jgi:hypothetical protein
MKLLKEIFWAMCVVASLSFLSWNNPAYAGGEEKKVCEDKKDKAGKVVKDKAGKVVQNCKTIKVHKKLEGTKVPDKK